MTHETEKKNGNFHLDLGRHNVIKHTASLRKPEFSSYLRSSAIKFISDGIQQQVVEF